MGPFLIAVSGFQPLSIARKCSIVDVAGSWFSLIISLLFRSLALEIF